MQTYFRVAHLGPVIWIVAMLAAIFVGGAVTLILSAVILVIYLVVDVPVPIDEELDRTAS